MIRPFISIVLSALTLAACDKPASKNPDTTTTPVVATSATASASTAAPTVSAISSGGATSAAKGKTLVDLTATAKLVRVKSGASKTVDIADAKAMQAILTSLGPAQAAAAGMPRCMTSYSVDFVDAKGATLASVGLCDAPGLAEHDKSEARLDVPGEKPGGFTVTDLAALRSALKPHGVELP